MTARLFAIAAHEAIGQKRRYTGEPYWKHCERVASLVTSAGGNQFMIDAAWLHDAIEDTKIDIETIYEEFPWFVGHYVEWLTNDKSAPTRAERKALDVEKYSGAPYAVCTIKCADIIDNAKCFIASGDEHATRRWMMEKETLLLVLKDGSDPWLWGQAAMIVGGYLGESKLQNSV